MFNVPSATALKVVFKAFLASDHITAATSKTITISISKNGAAFGAPSGGATATEIANGWYYIDLSTTDTGTAGPLAVHGTEGTIDPIGVLYNIMTAVTGLINVNAQLAGGTTVDTAATIATAVEAELGTGSSLTALATSAALTTVGSSVASIKTKTDFLPSATAGAASGVAIVGSAMSLTTTERDSIADAHLDRANGVETGLTVRQHNRVQAGVAAGNTTGMGTTTGTIKSFGIAGAINRVVATIDADGNRTITAINLT